MPPPLRRLLWFGALWVGGVSALAVLGAVPRYLFHP